MADHYNTLSDVLRAFDRAKDSTTTLAGEMMRLAGTFKDLEAFGVALKASEDARRAHINEKLVKQGAGKEEAALMLKLNPAYSQAKSNITSVWKMGKAPTSFKSYSELTIELNKARKAQREEGKAKGAEANTGKDAEALHTVTKGLTHAKRIEAVVFSLLALSDGNQAEVLDEWETILKDYEPEAREEVKTETHKGSIEVPVLEAGYVEAGSILEELEAAQVAAASN